MPGSASLQALRADVGAAFERGLVDVTIDIDEVGTLDAITIAALITVLRRARERSGSVTLRASRKGILATLHVTGLDKVFAVVPALQATMTVPAKPAGPAHKRRGVPSAVAAFAFAAGSAFASGASAAPETSAADIVHNVIAQNAEMDSYEAQVKVDLHLRSFPYVSQHLSGTTYFKRPDNFEVVFDKVPSYATGFDKLYSDVDDPTSWERRFDMSVVGERDVAGHRDVIVRLVQKVRGMIDHEDVAIDPAAWRIDGMDWHYYNGGFIGMSQQYKTVGRFTVLSKQYATIRIPFVHAAAEATYDDYRTNVAISDSVFTRDKH